MSDTGGVKWSSFEIHTGRRTAPDGRPAEAAARRFDMVLLGGFSGGSSKEPASSPPAVVRVDPDVFEAAMARLAPRASASTPYGAANLAFLSIEDFHPAAIVAQVPWLKEMADLCSRLRQAAAAPAARRDATARGWLASGAAPAEPAPADDAQAAAAFNDLLGAPARISEKPTETAGDAIGRLVRGLVEGGADHGPAAQAADQSDAEALESRLSDALRQVLHAPEVRAVETAWRSVDFLVRRFDAEEPPGVFLIDAPRARLAEWMEAVDDPARCGLRRVLVDAAERRYRLIIGLDAWGGQEGDTARLARLGVLAAAARAPFIADADPVLLGRLPPAGSDLLAKEMGADAARPAGWDALRASPVASLLGLVFPRFLLRLPYGKVTEPADPLSFEESPPGDPAAGCLWGPSAILAALLAGESFCEGEDAVIPPATVDIGGLPLLTYEKGGEQKMMPTGQYWISESCALAIGRQGLMPVISVRNSDSLRLPMWRSLSESGDFARLPD